MVMSACPSVRTFGVLVTVMPLRAAASTSMLSTPFEKGGNELQLRPGLLDQSRIDPVRHRRHEHVGPFDRGDQLRLAARRVIAVQLRVEELTHPGFDDIRQFAGDVDRWFFLACHCCERRPR